MTYSFVKQFFRVILGVFSSLVITGCYYREHMDIIKTDVINMISSDKICPNARLDYKLLTKEDFSCKINDAGWQGGIVLKASGFPRDKIFQVFIIFGSGSTTHIGNYVGDTYGDLITISRTGLIIDGGESISINHISMDGFQKGEPVIFAAVAKEGDCYVKTVVFPDQLRNSN